MPPRMILIGADGEAVSTVAALLADLPPDFPAAVIVVHPRPAEGVDDLLHALASSTALPVVEPDDRDDIEPGHVYVAPAGYHLLVDEGTFSLSREPPVEGQRPAPGLLFASVAEGCPREATAIFLTRRWEDRASALAAAGVCPSSTTVVPLPPAVREAEMDSQLSAPDVAAAMAWITAIRESRRVEERS